MAASSFCCISHPNPSMEPLAVSNKFPPPYLPHQNSQTNRISPRIYSKTSCPLSSWSISHKSLVPLAASIAMILWSSPANAGFLSGISGIESVPGPELPQLDFLSRFNDENQKKYAEADARFKESPLLKKLLEQSKLNKEKNRQATLDKYCVRGAEWGVGDCSAEGMSPEEKEKFISMLKQKAGIE